LKKIWITSCLVMEEMLVRLSSNLYVTSLHLCSCSLSPHRQPHALPCCCVATMLRRRCCQATHARTGVVVKQLMPALIYCLAQDWCVLVQYDPVICRRTWPPYGDAIG
jgi:hypothetical protein